MSEVVLVRRKRDGLYFDALQYGVPETRWDPDWLAQVASFVLGLRDVNKSTAVPNERILDVVRPVMTKFDPAAGVATIQIVDSFSGIQREIELGDWLLKRDQEPLATFRGYLWDEFERPTPENVADTETQELGRFIEKLRPYPENILPDKAKDMASKIISAGWRRS